MSTIVTRAGKGSPLTHNEVDANFNNLNSDKYESGSSPSFAGTTLSSGNLTFSGTAQRITGDMTNGALSSRLYFQTSTANSNTSVGAIPSGTAQVSSFNSFNSSDPNNAALLQAQALSTDVRLNSNAVGTGTYLPMTFYTGGSERVRIDTDGNLLVGTSGQIARLGVVNPTGGYGFAIQGQATDGQSILSSMDRSGTVYTGNITFPEDGSILFGRLNTGSQTTRMTIDSSGNVGIGGTALAYEKVVAKGTHPSSSGATRIFTADGVCPSATTSNFYSFISQTGVENASFTLANYHHFGAVQGTFGASATITAQYGYSVNANLIGATNNYGFFGNIPAGSNRWNFYAAGTAQNYFAGDTGIGGTPIAGVRLRIKGSTATNASYSISCVNSADTNTFFILNDGAFSTGQAANSPYNLTTGSAANVFVDSSGFLYRSTSSLRYKSDIGDAEHGLSDVLKLRSVTYKAKNSGDTVFGGLIAEEVHDAGLTEFVAYDKEGRPDALHYGNMVALLVKAVQELTARVAELEAK
jgi:hypothetical protein